MADVIPLWIVVLGLLDDVELVDAATSHACSGAPVAPVRRRIIVEEVVFKPVGAVTPIDAGVQREPRCNVLSTSIGHEPRVFELAHVRINKRVARHARFPRLQRGVVFSPRRGAVRTCAVQMENLISILERKKLIKVAPNEFENHPIRTLIFHYLTLVLSNLTHDVSRGNASEREPRRELGAVVAAQHSISSLKIRLQKFGLPQIILNTCQRLRFTTLKVHCTSFVDAI
mmetsp:Transcript_5384/g.11874  ORF Transcript_5384/g.11874 Transcript_5384/m.11874 type:complete len:229 (-) Transcript_5384:636-1322(-)